MRTTISVQKFQIEVGQCKPRGNANQTCVSFANKEKGLNPLLMPGMGDSVVLKLGFLAEFRTTVICDSKDGVAVNSDNRTFGGVGEGA